MLILTRKKNQSIYIGDDIVITICKINAQATSIAIEAPKEIIILREELLPEAADELEVP